MILVFSRVSDELAVSDLEVLTFCLPEHLHEMRRLLLEHGAQESADDVDQLQTRLRAEANEEAWLKKFHYDDR